MAFYQEMSWHEGEEKIHALTKVPHRDNPNNPGLSPRAAHQIQIFPLMAIGTTDPDNDNRPWTTIWGGEAPISQPVAPGGVIGIKATVDASFDPVVRALLGHSANGEVVQKPQDRGAMVSALSISLEARSRVKLFGRMIVGALNAASDADKGKTDDGQGSAGGAQLVVKIEQSLGNCPKYLNKKTITPHTNLKPRLISEDVILPDEAVDLIRNSDLFFVSSSHKFEDMDTNHRGGPPGFLRIRQPASPTDVQASVLVWPEYSGNNLYQTLGNLMSTPRAGIVIPDFETGNVLYLTGDTRVLLNNEANEVLPKSKLAVEFTVRGSRFVQDGLGFRGQPVEDGPRHGLSPYNPKIRFLRSEKETEFTKNYNSANGGADGVSAKLIQKTPLSPTLTKYRFALSDPSTYGPWKPGQHVAFDFSEEMDMGYSHMRDDDPTSLNDDYIRTFTVASSPNLLGVHGEEFEVIIRKVGNVTSWLSWQREGITEIGVLGFGGEFTFNDHEDDKTQSTRKKAFVAQGIGITPLLGQLGVVKDLKVRWTINVQDVGAVINVLNSCSDEVKRDMVIYLTGKDEDIHDNYKNFLDQLSATDVHIERRRLVKEDLTTLLDDVDDWYMCAAPAFRHVIQDWLPEKSIIFENFDY